MRRQGSVIGSISPRAGLLEPPVNGGLGLPGALAPITPRRGLEPDPFFLHLKNEVHREQFDGELLTDELRKVHIRLADVQEERRQLTDANDDRISLRQELKQTLVDLQAQHEGSRTRIQEYETALEAIHAQRQETVAEGRRRQLLLIQSQQELVQMKHALEMRKQTAAALKSEVENFKQRMEEPTRVSSADAKMKKAQQLGLGAAIPPDPAPALIAEAQSEAAGLHSRLKLLRKDHEELKSLAIGSQLLAEIEIAKRKCQSVASDIRQKFPDCPLLEENIPSAASKEATDQLESEHGAKQGGRKTFGKMKSAVQQINKARHLMGFLDAAGGKKTEPAQRPKKPEAPAIPTRPQPKKPEHYTLMGVSKDFFKRPTHLPRTGRVRLRLRRGQHNGAIDRLNHDLRELGGRRTVPRSMCEAVLQCTGNGSAVRWQLARLRAEDQSSRRAMLREQCRCRGILRWSNDRASAANDKAAKVEHHLELQVTDLKAKLKNIQDETAQAHGSHIAVRVIHDFYMTHAEWLHDQIQADAEDLQEAQHVSQQWHSLPPASRMHHFAAILRRKLDNKAARLKAVTVGCAGLELDIRKIERKQIREGVGEGGSVRWIASGELVDGDAQTDPSGYISSWHLYKDEVALADGRGGVKRGVVNVSVLDGMGVLVRLSDPSSNKPLCLFVDTEHARFLCQDTPVFGFEQIANANENNLVAEEDFSGKRIVQWLRVEWLKGHQHLVLPRTPHEFGASEDQVYSELPLECICNDKNALTDGMIFKGLPCVVRVLECHCRVCGLAYLHVGVYCPLTGWAAWRSRVARDLSRIMGHRTIGSVLQDWQNDITRIRMQALVSEIFAADVPTDPAEGATMLGIPPLIPASTEVFQWAWRMREEEKGSLVRAHMRGNEKMVLVNARNKRESQKNKRASIVGGAAPGLLRGMTGNDLDSAASAALVLRKNIDEDAKNFAKACEELAFLRFDTEIGPDGNVTMAMHFDEPPYQGQIGAKSKKMKNAKARSSVVAAMTQPRTSVLNVTINTASSSAFSATGSQGIF
eukprot:gnl/MRDRNA2_/MRDRNA2_106327_c0_seq1.p1 gnl/MRDRNA2_/MRDRNA2_106327_c0~~gnl/MRDRNA2_/MRDRNA2_106327_c0_seq1.p1  ORF type:complete len:1038 (+),score=185.99 gnl/MRDRNA2_/MRDRNA2_106327_c0_seq1:53-3166(+)